MQVWQWRAGWPWARGRVRLRRRRRFAYARTLHAGFPASFLALERFKWLLAGLVDDTRPMDFMPLSLDTPAEDEIAVSALTGGAAGRGATGGCPGRWLSRRACMIPRSTVTSPCPDALPCCRANCAPPCAGTVSAYMPLVFMRDRHRFDAFYTFEGASEAEFDSWRSSLLWFLKKVEQRRGLPQVLVARPAGCRPSTTQPEQVTLSAPRSARLQVTLRWGGCKPLLIKSPVHTARLKLLLKLFPRARFVYVHRDPLSTFQSAAHMANTYYWWGGQQAAMM